MLHHIYRSQNSPAAKALEYDTKTSLSPKAKRKPKDPSIPAVPFGTDLLYWGEEKMELPLVVRFVYC